MNSTKVSTVSGHKLSNLPSSILIYIFSFALEYKTQIETWQIKLKEDVEFPTNLVNIAASIFDKNYRNQVSTVSISRKTSPRNTFRNVCDAWNKALLEERSRILVTHVRRVATSYASEVLSGDLPSYKFQMQVNAYFAISPTEKLSALLGSSGGALYFASYCLYKPSNVNYYCQQICTRLKRFQYLVTSQTSSNSSSTAPPTANAAAVIPALLNTFGLPTFGLPATVPALAGATSSTSTDSSPYFDPNLLPLFTNVEDLTLTNVQLSTTLFKALASLHHLSHLKLWKRIEMDVQRFTPSALQQALTNLFQQNRLQSFHCTVPVPIEDFSFIKGCTKLKSLRIRANPVNYVSLFECLPKSVTDLGLGVKHSSPKTPPLRFNLAPETHYPGSTTNNLINNQQYPAVTSLSLYYPLCTKSLFSMIEETFPNLSKFSIHKDASDFTALPIPFNHPTLSKLTLKQSYYSAHLLVIKGCTNLRKIHLRAPVEKWIKNNSSHPNLETLVVDVSESWGLDIEFFVDYPNLTHLASPVKITNTALEKKRIHEYQKSNTSKKFI